MLADDLNQRFSRSAPGVRGSGHRRPGSNDLQGSCLLMYWLPAALGSSMAGIPPSWGKHTGQRIRQRSCPSQNIQLFSVPPGPPPKWWQLPYVKQELLKYYRLVPFGWLMMRRAITSVAPRGARNKDGSRFSGTGSSAPRASLRKSTRLSS